MGIIDKCGVHRDATICIVIFHSCHVSSFPFSFIIRPSSDGTYYGIVMSVRSTLRPGLRPPVFRTFLIHALIY